MRKRAHVDQGEADLCICILDWIQFASFSAKGGINLHSVLCISSDDQNNEFLRDIKILLHI